jgi:hypothetical protein
MARGGGFFLFGSFSFFKEGLWKCGKIHRPTGSGYEPALRPHDG